MPKYQSLVDTLMSHQLKRYVVFPFQRRIKLYIPSSHHHHAIMVLSIIQYEKPILVPPRSIHPHQNHPFNQAHVLER